MLKSTVRHHPARTAREWIMMSTLRWAVATSTVPDNLYSRSMNVKCIWILFDRQSEVNHFELMLARKNHFILR